MHRIKRASVLVVVMAVAFAGLSRGVLGGGQAGGALPPDVVYYGGKIATVNPDFDFVQAVGVHRGRILAAGSNEAVRALASSSTRLVDLQGRTVLPGFYDNHVHLSMGSAPSPLTLDVWEATSLDEVLSALRRRAAEVPKGEWIRVELPYVTAIPHPFSEDKAPTRLDLDKAAPAHPVYVTRGHLAVVNTLALQKAKITKDTQVAGGVIDRDTKGELTGKLRERPAHRLIERVMPPEPRLDREGRKAGMRRFLKGLLGLGITSANIAGIELTSSDDWRLVQEVYALEGDMLPRLTIQARIRQGYDRYDNLKTGIATTIRELEATPFRTGFGNDRVKIGAIKMSIDGAFSGPTAWTLDPYPDRPLFRGVARIPEEGLYPVASRAHELGWQLGIHAIGDAAVEMTVNVLERILKESPRADARHFVHHFTARPPEATLDKVARLGIIVASQPNWIFSKMQFIAQVLRGDRLETAEPQKSLIDRGIHVSYGSDGHPHGPVVGIYAAVTRRSSDGRVYGPGERVTVERAIRSYTLETAYMNFEEKDRGSLEIGKLADMIVLTEDIFTIDPERIKDLGIEQTIVGGEVVHSPTTPGKPFQNIDHPWWTKATTTSSR